MWSWNSFLLHFYTYRISVPYISDGNPFMTRCSQGLNAHRWSWWKSTLNKKKNSWVQNVWTFSSKEIFWMTEYKIMGCKIVWRVFGTYRKTSIVGFEGYIEYHLYHLCSTSFFTVAMGTCIYILPCIKVHKCCQVFVKFPSFSNESRAASLNTRSQSLVQDVIVIFTVEHFKLTF